MAKDQRYHVPEATKPKTTATARPTIPPPPKHAAPLPTMPRITSAQQRLDSPTTSSQRLRATPYVASQRSPRVQTRRFSPSGPVGWFNVVAHKIDLVVHPSLAVLVVLMNISMQWIWALIQIVATFLPDDARRQIRNTRAPRIQPDHPFAAVLFFAALFFLVGGLTRPILWPNHEPREFTIGSQFWSINASNPFKAVNIVKEVANIVLPVPVTGPVVQVQAPARPAGDHDVQGAPSVTPDQINQILQSYNSPAVGSGQAWYDLGKKYNIDPAYAVAFFIHESSAGTNPAWAGLKSDGGTTHNIGNIICAGYSTCYGRFRDYPTWDAGIDDWYRLISVEYIQGRGTTTVDQIVPVYAPSFENDVQAYVGSVTSMVDGWRTHGVQ